MIRSMTGFGTATFETGGVRFSVEMRSVNHRHSDVRVRLPRRFAEIESRLAGQVQQAVSRGKVDVTVSAADGGEAPQVLELNAPL
ncbi:MAG: YicC/YloC family endoribonuclease, partial [Deltaproteobacteria bacterium]|nr:YicC/YloC family endoribonuclease [Deltaproteobacteria bacterium]